jgi:hypothetical protein
MVRCSDFSVSRYSSNCLCFSVEEVCLDCGVVVGGIVEVVFVWAILDKIEESCSGEIIVAAMGWTSSVSCVASLGDCWGWVLRA